MIPRPKNAILGYFLYSGLLDRPDMTYGDGAKCVQVLSEARILESQRSRRCQKLLIQKSEGSTD